MNIEIEIPLYDEGRRQSALYQDNSEIINEVLEMCFPDDFMISNSANAIYYTFWLTDENAMYLKMKYPDYEKYKT